MEDGTGDTFMCAELGNAAYVMVPNKDTVTKATKKIEAVMNGHSSTDIE